MSEKIFVAYPLSSATLERLNPFANNPFDHISLGNLRSLSILSIIKILRTTSKMHVILETKESEQLSDIFLVLFLFTKSRRIDFIRDDLTQFSLQKKEAVLALLKCGVASIIGLYDVCKSFLWATFLSSQKRPLPITNPSKIFYLKTNFWFGVKAGGSVAHVEGVIGGLRKNKVDVEYSALDCQESLLPLVERVHMLPLPQYLSLDRSMNLCRSDWLIHKTLKKASLASYDFIYHRMALNSLSGLLLARRLKRPLVLEYNGSEVWVQKNWGKPLLFQRVSQKIEDANIRCADYIVTVSDVLKDELIGRGVAAERIISYPNCVDPEKFDPALFPPQVCNNKRKTLGLSQNDVVLTFIGSFGQWHGVNSLAKAIHHLSLTQDKWLKEANVKFVLIGDGACMAEVRETLATIPNYADFVTLTGLVPQEEAPAYLAMSDILLSPHSPPSTQERFFGSPTKLFEYMAMEKVIIASDLDQIGEVLSPAIHINKIEERKESDLAILCAPGDVTELAKAIKYAVDHLPHLTSMGHNARCKALSTYTWERHVREILNILTQSNASCRVGADG